MELTAGAETMATNSSSALPSSPPAVGITLLVLALLLGLPGNLFVVWTILFKLRKRSVTSLLILQLAAADALVLLTAPFFLHTLVMGGAWEFGQRMCQLLHYWCGVNMYASVYVVSLMSADRLLGVSRPLLTQRVRTKSRLWPALAAVWALALLLSIPVPLYHRMRNDSCVAYHPSDGHRVFQYGLETVAAFLLPFSVLAWSYCCIARRLAAGRARWRRRARGRTNRLIALIVTTFLLLWAPYHLLNVLQVGAILGGSRPLQEQCQRVRPVLIALAFLSSSINPLLYACAGSTFTRSARLHCLTRLLEAPSSGSSRREESRRPGEEAQSMKMGQREREEAGGAGRVEEEENHS
ncbi:leukotriene B4 receptor 1-like [Megalops cyprinoides]|uniref:leukotriene B4 receptor 1-like n=1 Tax=Megalops cyprinoides TaxID=118141 RepID=UPI0018646C99|nr:leukotriene B4 receptor 1-like [Megalops cyprinoides]